MKMLVEEQKKKKNPKVQKKTSTHLLDVLHDAADRHVTVLVAQRVDVNLVGAVEVLCVFVF